MPPTKGKPRKGLSYGIRKTRARSETWEPEDLAKLFKAPLWQSYALDPRPAMCGAALYWIPLCQVLMGSRPGEFAQLQVRDVIMSKGVMLMSINDEGEDHAQGKHAKRVKTEAAIRKVPVHPELLRLGFADYLEDMRARVGEDGLLFDDLHRTEKIEAREHFSNAFRNLTRDLRIYRQWRDNYSLRTTVVTALKSVTPALDADLVVAIIGHEKKSLAGAHYFKPTPDKLLAAIEHVKVPAVEALPRVYPSRT